MSIIKQCPYCSFQADMAIEIYRRFEMVKAVASGWNYFRGRPWHDVVTENEAQYIVWQADAILKQLEQK